MKRVAKAQNKNMQKYRMSELVDGFMIRLMWDEDARVWVATSDEVPGLVLESADRSALLERIRRTIPELLDMDHIPFA